MIDTTVTIAALAIVATSVGALIWIVKYLMTGMRASIDKNTESHNKVASSNVQIVQATKVNTQVSQETLQFLKNLNGRLTQITAEKIMDKEKKHV